MDAYNTVMLLIVAGGAFLYLNEMGKTTPLCKRWGFILTIAGAFGEAILPWVPRFREEAALPEFMLHTGLALIALSLVRGQLRDLLARASLAWDGTERRKSRG